MVEEKVTFRSTNANDWPIIISWLNVEWDSGSEHFHKVEIARDMKHCRFMVAVGKDDIPLSYMAYAVFDAYVYVNNFITDQKSRGKGIGRRLWNWVMDTDGRDKVGHLLSTEPMTEKYCKISGFRYISPITCLVYSGYVSVEKLGQIILSDRKVCNRRTPTEIFSKFDENLIRNVIDYDLKIRNRKEGDFLESYLRQNLQNTVRTVCAQDENGHMTGYGSIVKVKNLRKLGPLIADNFFTMLILVENLIGYDFSNDNNHGCQKLVWSLPSTNRNVVEFLENCLEFTLDIALNRSFTEKVDYDYYPENIYCLVGQIGNPN